MNSLSSMFQSIDDDIAMWPDLGIDHVGLITPKLDRMGWEAARALVGDPGLRVSNLSVEERVVDESLRFAWVGAIPCTSRAAAPARALGEAAAAFCANRADAALADELGSIGRRADQSAPHRRELRVHRS